MDSLFKKSKNTNYKDHKDVKDHSQGELLKAPPQSIEAEQAVLGGLMIDPQSFEKIADVLHSDSFYRPEHQAIYQAISVLAIDNKPIDTLTVAEQLKQEHPEEDLGELIAYMVKMANATPSAANINAYADIVSERAVLRQLISTGAKISESAYSPQGKACAELLDDAEREVFAIAEKRSRGQGPMKINAIAAAALGLIEKRMLEGGAVVTGLPSGFTEYDKMTSGLQPGELVILAGRPSMGKTTLAMNMAEYAAMKTKKAVLVFSMEMPSEQLVLRLISSIGGIDQHKIRTGKLSEEDWPRLTHAITSLNQTKIYIDETPGLSPLEMRARARRVARKEDLGLIVVDYLQLMRSSGNAENRTAEISEISRSLKSLAKELHVPLIALSQLNRSLEQRPNKRPVMSDLRESGAIEQDADVIGFIYRDEVYNDDSPDKGIAEIIIAKQRNGPIGTVRLTFRGATTRFDNFAHETYVPV